MITINGLGTFDIVPKMVENIVNEDITALDNHFSKRWNIDKKIDINGFLLSPIEIALRLEVMASIQWLVEHGVNLNKKYNHSFAVAVRYLCVESPTLFFIPLYVKGLFF